ncbi:chromosome segregation in meiosis- protein [Dimargaris xerosporica]|nr:chromosome segregation in meiosis- protein [Dimargaris xerosporica]
MNAPQSVSQRRAAPEKPWAKAATARPQAPKASSNSRAAHPGQPAPLAVAQQAPFDSNGNELDQLQAVRKRKKAAKLDAEKMLAPEGLKYLRSHGPRLKFYGPGHEAQDLAKLMQFYRLWAHHLFPKLQFAEFIREAEKVCSQKRLRVHLDEWKKAETTALHHHSTIVSPHEPADTQDRPDTTDWSADTPIDESMACIGTCITTTTANSSPSADDHATVTIAPTNSSTLLSNEAQHRIEDNRARALARLEASRRHRELQMQQEPDFDAFSDEEQERPDEPVP